MHREEIMGHLILRGDTTTYPGFSLLDEPNLTITWDDIGFLPLNTLEFLVLRGTTSVSIVGTGNTIGISSIEQLAEKDNVLTTVTLSGPELLTLGSSNSPANSGDGVVTDIAATATSPTKIHSSLTLIDASATTGGVWISAGATNTSGGGLFGNGASLDPNVTITYTGLTIKGGSGGDLIENDAKNGIVIGGNGGDSVTLGGAGAKANLGTGNDDQVRVGFSTLGTNEAPGAALGDKITFGAAATAKLVVDTGAEAGSTAVTTNIGLTKVVNAASGMKIDFSAVTNASVIVNETAAVATAHTLTEAENAAVDALGGPGVAFFHFGDNAYFIATNHNETSVNFDDAVVKLIGVHDLNAPTNLSGLVTLHG
jgi:hypothetical protein